MPGPNNSCSLPPAIKASISNRQRAGKRGRKVVMSASRVLYSEFTHLVYLSVYANPPAHETVEGFYLGPLVVALSWYNARTVPYGIVDR